MSLRTFALAACGMGAMTLGCGGRSSALEGHEGAREPAACEGAIDGRGALLRSDVARGRLFTAGDRLILVESGGRVLSIDRCSGEGFELAPDIGNVTASVLVGDHVWFLAGHDTLALSRLLTAGGPVELVLADAPASNLVTDGVRVYFFDGHGTSSADVWLAADSDPPATPIATIAAPAGTQLRLLAAGPAGLYFTYDCDCAPSLSRYALGEPEPSSLEGAGAAGIWGSYAVGVGPDRLYVALNSSGGGVAVKRLPFEGGVAEELLGTGTRRSTLRANGQFVCWLDGPLNGPTSLNCLSLLDERRPHRKLGSVPSIETMSLALADDAVYWLRPREGDESYEIFAAAL
jgi:hypothetical protein